MIAIAEATLQQAEDTVGQVQRQFDFGAVAEFSLLSARVDRDNQIPVLNRARANRDVAYLRLKQLLDIPATEEIQLTSDLESDPLQVPARYAAQFAEVETKLSTNTTIDRAAVRTEAANVERQEANLHQAKAEARPSISAASDYAKVAYPNGIVSGFGDIRTNWTVGFSLTLPLLTGGRQNGNEAIAGAQLKAEREQLALAQDTADLDARTSWAELTAAQSTWQATESTVALARRAYEVAGIRFGLGVSTQLEISDARLQLQIAEANRAQAARDLQVARIRLALLPALPLTRTAPSSTPAIATPASVPGTSAPATGAPASTPSTTIPTGATRREAF
jgi:outer membrane protein TolC